MAAPWRNRPLIKRLVEETTPCYSFFCSDWPSVTSQSHPRLRKDLPMLHLLWMFIVGIVVGAIARLIMPGPQHLGILLTGILGIAGSLIGGLIARIFSKP